MATTMNPENRECYLYSGILKTRVEDYRGALRDFNKAKCKSKHPEEHADLDRYIRRVKRFKRELPRIVMFRRILMAIVVAQLVALWLAVLYDEVTNEVFSVLVPILLGVLVVAGVLPSLIRLKLPGLEADLTEPKEKLSSGLIGDVGLSLPTPIIATGPR